MAISLKLSCVSPKTQRATTPTTSPTAMPRVAARTKSSSVLLSEKAPLIAAAIATR